MDLRLDLTSSPLSPGRGGDHGRSYGGMTGEERDAARRERLLVAIHDIVGNRGYGGLTVERLCAAASVSSRSFYQLYPGKEAAFADLYDALLKQAGARVVESLDRTARRPIAERVPDAMASFLRPMLEDPRTARICFVEVVGHGAVIEATRMRNRELLIGLIGEAGAEAVARGELSEREFRFAAIALISSTTALIGDWMLDPHRPPRQWLEERLTGLAVHLLTS